MSSSSALRLASYLTAENYESLPAEVIEKSKLCLLDALGCLIGAYRSSASIVVESFVSDLGNSGDVHVAGGHLKTDCATAAFANATLINALDFDDIYKKGHPGATVISTALAVGQKVGCSGRELIEAIVVGYEISCRVGISMSHVIPRRLIHGHGTWQTLGAAATAAKLFKLDTHKAAHALAIAASNAPVASVMKTVYGALPSMAKNNFGTAAQVEVNAALLARNGFEGPLDVFDGPTGFWRMFGADGCDFLVLSGELGAKYEILEVGFKRYSCCRILQSSIEAVIQVFQKAMISPQEGEYHKIVVSTPPIVCEWPFNNRKPDSLWSAQFSGPYTFAMALLGIEAGPDWFTTQNLNNPAVKILIEKIELLPRRVAATDQSHHTASAELQLNNGERISSMVAVAKGEAANPLSRHFIEEKFVRLASPRLQLETCRNVLGLISKLEKMQTFKPSLLGRVGD